MNLTIQLTPEDYIQATRLHIKPRPVLKWVGYLFLALLVFVLCVAFYFMVKRREFDATPFILILLSTFLISIFFYSVPRQCRKIFAQQKSMQVPYSLNVNDEGIHAKSEISDEQLPWNHFIRWKENDNLFMIYQSDAMFRMIPKRCFASSEQIVEFRQLLENKLGPI